MPRIKVGINSLLVIDPGSKLTYVQRSWLSLSERRRFRHLNRNRTHYQWDTGVTCRQGRCSRCLWGRTWTSGRKLGRLAVEIWEFIRRLIHRRLTLGSISNLRWFLWTLERNPKNSFDRTDPTSAALQVCGWFSISFYQAVFMQVHKMEKTWGRGWPRTDWFYKRWTTVFVECQFLYLLNDDLTLITIINSEIWSGSCQFSVSFEKPEKSIPADSDIRSKYM